MQVVLKLGDFGLAAVLEQGTPKDNAGSGGDGRYVCPAVMNQRCQDLRHADIFSLAASVYAMVIDTLLWYALSRVDAGHGQHSIG